MAPMNSLKSAPVEGELLMWNLWTRKDRSKAVSYKSELTRLGRLGRPALIYAVLALAVMLPMLAPGFILTLDMVFTPELRMPGEMSSSYLFHAALHYLNFVLPADVIQKIMLFAILVLSGFGMHLLVRHIQNSKDLANEFALWGAYIAGAFYMVNPFTYSRFMAGQYAVLLGYALLPFLVKAVLEFFAVPTLKRSLVIGLWLTVIGIVSVHTLGLAAVLITSALAVCAWRSRHNSSITLSAINYGLVGLGVFVAASGYWIFPLIGGHSNQGMAVSQFSVSDQQAFATSGGDLAGQFGNLLQLQGFWAESEGLYLLPQEQLPGWALVVLLVWILVGIGLRRVWREHRAIALLFVASGLGGIILAIVGTSGIGALAGFREPQKFAGLLALAYAVFAGFGTVGVLAWARKKGDALFAGAATLALLLPVLFTPVMFWGFSNQLSARQYPADWYQINEYLDRDTDDFRVLALPWHLYQHYQFAGRVIADPTEKFFDKPIIASNELEFKNASPTFPDDDKKLLSEQILPKAKNNPGFGKELDSLGIKYILLSKTYDHNNFGYLDGRGDLELEQETATIKLYRNLAYGKSN